MSQIVVDMTHKSLLLYFVHRIGWKNRSVTSWITASILNVFINWSMRIWNHNHWSQSATGMPRMFLANSDLVNHNTRAHAHHEHQLKSPLQDILLINEKWTLSLFTEKTHVRYWLPLSSTTLFKTPLRFSIGRKILNPTLSCKKAHVYYQAWSSVSRFFLTGSWFFLTGSSIAILLNWFGRL